jgi:hypothetical protein
MRTIAIPDYRSTPGNRGLTRYVVWRATAHFLMIIFWESEEAIRAFAGDDISVAKYYDFDEDVLLELEPCSRHYEMYDNQCCRLQSGACRTLPTSGLSPLYEVEDLRGANSRGRQQDPIGIV